MNVNTKCSSHVSYFNKINVVIKIQYISVLIKHKLETFIFDRRNDVGLYYYTQQ